MTSYFYFTANSMSWRDAEPCTVIGYASRQDAAILPCSGLPAVSHKKIVLFFI